MKQLTILEPVFVRTLQAKNGGHCEKGEEIEVPDAEATQLIASGRAIETAELARRAEKAKQVADEAVERAKNAEANAKAEADAKIADAQRAAKEAGELAKSAGKPEKVEKPHK